MKNSEMLKPSLQLLVKLGSIAVHTEEMISASGHKYDRIALESLLLDPEVKEWVEVMTEAAYLPVTRSKPGVRIK